MDQVGRCKSGYKVDIKEQHSARKCFPGQSKQDLQGPGKEVQDRIAHLIWRGGTCAPQDLNCVKRGLHCQTYSTFYVGHTLMNE